MKYLKNYNESLYGELSRLNPNRMKNDEKLYDLFEEIKEDFEKYGRDLKKVKLINDNGSPIKIGDSLDIGMSGSLYYLFGKYHPVTNDPHTDNKKAGNREVKISYVPFSIVFRKNSLEKAFNTSRFNPLKINITDTKIINNPEYNPNLSTNLLNRNEYPTENDRKKMVRLNTIVDEYKVSPDIAGKIMKYFIKEYKLKYPKLNKSKFKGSNQIKDMEDGVQPILKFGSVKSKDDKDVTYSLRYGEDENSKREMISRMTKKEYDEYYKKRNKELYKPHEDKKKEIEDQKISEISNIISKYNIDFREDKFFKNKKYEIRYYGYSIKIVFMIENYKENDTELKIKELISDKYFDEYESNYNIRDTYDKKFKWVDIHFDK